MVSIFKTMSLHYIATLFQRAPLTRTMSLTIDKGFTVFTIFSLFHPISTSCNSLLTAKDMTKIYCDDIGIGSYFMSYHECKYTCMQKATCIAINYNIEHGTRILLPVPCPQSIADQNMKYAIFSSRYQEDCIEWINYTVSMAHDERWVLTKVCVCMGG